MAACEKCWSDAAWRVQELGGSQVERYEELLKERYHNPCTEVEQGVTPEVALEVKW